MLSPRQREILGYLAEGLAIKQAADRMGIGYGTAKRHSEAARANLGARTKTQAVAIAVRKGIV